MSHKMVRNSAKEYQKTDSTMNRNRIRPWIYSVPILLTTLLFIRLIPTALAQSCGDLQITPSFTIVYGTVYVDGFPALPPVHIEAVSPRGERVGCFKTIAKGLFGTMYLYGKDSGVSPPIPGMDIEEQVKFKVNGRAAKTTSTLFWSADRDLHRVNLIVGNQPTVTPTPTATATKTPYRTQTPTPTSTFTPSATPTGSSLSATPTGSPASPTAIIETPLATATIATTVGPTAYSTESPATATAQAAPSTVSESTSVSTPKQEQTLTTTPAVNMTATSTTHTTPIPHQTSTLHTPMPSLTSILGTHCIDECQVYLPAVE